ncbi:G-protein coupled receptor [Dirofilaria immitis]|nr:G-protein coupled receptor [Dirofilaria immitis]
MKQCWIGHAVGSVSNKESDAIVFFIWGGSLLCKSVVRRSQFNWARCSYLAKSSVADCSGQHFNKIAQTPRLNAPRSEFYPSTIRRLVHLLNLSRNAFKSINSSSFSSLWHSKTLEVLDLSYNTLMFISPGAFKTLSNLKILLLNNNQLHALDRLSFVELESLEELNLDSNPLSSFPDGTFASLAKLRRISIMSNQLLCDCQITDLLRFVKNEQVQVSSRTMCIFPHSLRGMQVAKLNVKTLKRSCGKGNFNPAVFDLEPVSRSLIVYPDDRKNITCKVSKSNDIQMEWLKNNIPLADSSRLFTTRHSDSEFLYLKLCLNPVIWEDEGDWTCYVEHDGSVLRNTVRLTPVLVNTVHCVQEWQADEKGEIIWAVSQEGLVTAKCPNGPANAKAYRRCKHGRWDTPDTSRCAYTSSPLIYVDELLRIKRPFEMSAYETRLVGWLIGNATGLSSRQMLAALNFVLQSEFARTELDGKLMRQYLQHLHLTDQIIQEDNLAMCQYLFAESYDDTEAEIMRNGFLPCVMVRNFYAANNSGTSLRIPRLTIDQFPSSTIIRVLWLSNSKIFKNRYTSDGRWTVVGEVYGVAIKHISLRSLKLSRIPEEITKVGENDDFYGFLISYQINKTVDEIQLGVWDDEEGWKLTKKQTVCCGQITSSGKSIKLMWYTCASFGFLASVMILTVIVNVTSRYCSRRNQQVIINICACIFVLCSLYSLAHSGIRDPDACKAVTIALYGAIMEMYFVAYGIPLIVMSTVLAIDTLPHDRSSKFCFPSSMMRIKIFAYTVYAALFICATLTLGIVVIILRLLITAKRLIVEQYVDNKSVEESNIQIKSKTISAELSKRASAATTQLLWLLLIAVLYSLDCYAAAIHINQLNDSRLSTTPSSYFNALFNILLALAIFATSRLNRYIRDSGCSECVTKSFVTAPHNYKERIMPLLRRELTAGYFAE